MIKVSVHGDLVEVTLNRPDKANALTAPMLAQLIDAIVEFGPKAKVLVLTGSGKVFSAGADLEAVKDGLAVSPLWEELSGAIAELGCFTIAKLNGTLAGGAFGMALACDVRVCVPGAKFFYPAIKLGVLPQPSDPVRLAALVGPARAKMILVAGQKISAQTAYEWGLVDAIFAPDGLADGVADIAAAALDAKRDRIAAIKTLVTTRTP